VRIAQAFMPYQTADHGHPPRLRPPPTLLPAPSPAVTPALNRLFQGYVSKLEITPVHEGPGRARLRMPCTPAHLDETGSLHAGAVASLVDIAAVAASWGLGGRRPGARGSTLRIQVRLPGPTREGAVARAHGHQRAEALLVCTVHVTAAMSGQLVALGRVSYRMLEPWPAPP